MQYFLEGKVKGGCSFHRTLKSAVSQDRINELSCFFASYSASVTLNAGSVLQMFLLKLVCLYVSGICDFEGVPRQIDRQMQEDWQLFFSLVQNFSFLMLELASFVFQLKFFKLLSIEALFQGGCFSYLVICFVILR